MRIIERTDVIDARTVSSVSAGVTKSDLVKMAAQAKAKIIYGNLVSAASAVTTHQGMFSERHTVILSPGLSEAQEKHEIAHAIGYIKYARPKPGTSTSFDLPGEDDSFRQLAREFGSILLETGSIHQASEKLADRVDPQFLHLHALAGVGR